MRANPANGPWRQQNQRVPHIPSTPACDHVDCPAAWPVIISNIPTLTGLMPGTPFSLLFRQARQRHELTQVQVAKALQVSQSAVAQWESGRSFPSEPMAAKIEGVLGLRYRPSEDPQPAKDRPSRRRRLPVVGLPAPGDEERILVDGLAHGDLPSPPQLEDVSDAKAVYVRGSAMEPRYYAGEVVYLDPTRTPNPGDYVFVTVREPGFPSAIGYIRQFLGADLVHVRLLALNPQGQHLVARQDLLSMSTIVGSGLL